MFCLIAALLYADQNLLAPTLSLIAKDFGFNDVVRPAPALPALNLSSSTSVHCWHNPIHPRKEAAP